MCSSHHVYSLDVHEYLTLWGEFPMMIAPLVVTDFINQVLPLSQQTCIPLNIWSKLNRLRNIFVCRHQILNTIFLSMMKAPKHWKQCSTDELSGPFVYCTLYIPRICMSNIKYSGDM
jgi:hypothetical protein